MLNRRHALGAVLASLAGTAFAASDDYPNKPITILIPAPAGGGLDLIARALADEMTKSLKQPILVDNRPGGGGIIATQMAARAHPDGYTVALTITQAVMNNMFLFAKMPYDPRRDLAFVSEICTAQAVMVANASVPANTPAELLAWLKSHPDQAMYGSWGPGSYGHIVGSYLASSRGVPMVHVPYKGEAPMVQDLVGGQLPWAMASLATARPHIDSGRLRALAITGEHRADTLPQVPTFAEAGLADKQLEVSGSVMLVAPAATPPAVLARLEKASIDALDSPALRARMQVVSFIPLGWSGKKSRENYDTMYPLQEQLFKSLNIKAE